MKTPMWTVLFAVAALGAALPCQSTNPRGVSFEKVDPGDYRQLAYAAADHGAVIVATKSGECLEVRAVGMRQMRSLQKRAVSLAEPVILDFQGQDCWRVWMFLGADTFDPARNVELTCYARQPNGQPDVQVGTARVRYNFGPLATYLDQPGFVLPGAYLRLDATEQPLDYCELTGAPGVFMSWLWYTFETVDN